MEHRKTSSGTVQELRAVFAKSQLTGTLGSSQESTSAFMDPSSRVDPDHSNKDLVMTNIDSTESEAQPPSINVSCKKPLVKPFIGPKPTVDGQGTKQLGIKNLVASLEGSHGMYTSKNLHGKRAITVRDLRENSENSKPADKDSQVKSTLIKKERVILCDSKKQSVTSVDQTESESSCSLRSPCQPQVTSVSKEDGVARSLEGGSDDQPASKVGDHQESTDKSRERDASEACRSDKELHSVISADNYVCKRRVVHVRRPLPSKASLGPEPAKPARPKGMRLPFQERTHLSAENGSGSTCSSSGDSLPPPPVPDRNPNSFVRPPNRVPPKPPRSPPKPHLRTVPPEVVPCRPSLTSDTPLVTTEEEEEIYNDIILTVEPATPPNLPLSVDDDEDLYDDHENFPPSLPKCPPPSPPGLAPHSPSQPDLQQGNLLLLSASGSSYNQDSSENEDTENIYEAPLGPEYVNTEDVNKGKKKIKKKKLKLEQKNLEKIERKRDKFMKMFSLTGEEIPLDAGFVKSDSKGSKYDLNVFEGETVLILRMENNPSGKWLAKNGKGRSNAFVSRWASAFVCPVGYVELTNIQVDVESVKSVMTVRASQIYGEDGISVPQKEIAEADETNTF